MLSETSKTQRGGEPCCYAPKTTRGGQYTLATMGVDDDENF